MIKKEKRIDMLTLRPPITTIVPYANSFDQDETANNSFGFKLFDTWTTFSPILRDIETL